MSVAFVGQTTFGKNLNNQIMKSTVIKYGLYGFLAGLIIFTLHLVLGIENLDYSTNEILGYVSIFLSLSFIFFGIKHYRDKVNNGVITMGKAIAIGLLISLLVGLGIAIADFCYTKFGLLHIAFG